MSLLNHQPLFTLARFSMALALEAPHLRLLWAPPILFPISPLQQVGFLGQLVLRGPFEPWAVPGPGCTEEEDSQPCPCLRGPPSGEEPLQLMS